MTFPKSQSQDRFTVLPSGIRICYRIDGVATNPSVLLIGGLGEDLTAWSQRFVDALLASQLFVVRMDNRDSGRSSFAATPPPNALRQILTLPRSDAYTLSDLAADCAALLSHLRVGPTHLVGRSMGGMIAQIVAARFPAVAASLTSLYSTTGNSKVGQAAWSTRLMLVGRQPRTRVEAVQAHLRMAQHLAGTSHPINEVVEAEHAVTTWDRTAGDPAAGVARQIQAIQVSGDRTTELRTIVAPSLVINGDRDRIIDPSGGLATVDAISHAQHAIIPGMGHHIPDSLIDPIVARIVCHIHHAHSTLGGPTKAARTSVPSSSSFSIR